MPYNQHDDDDAFGSTKTPSLSWKGLPIGSVFTLEVLAPAKILHSRNFETGQPDYWDPPLNQNPKLSAVVNVLVKAGPHSVEEERSVWATRPSALYAAIATAQKEAGAKLASGGILHLKFSGETPHENKRYSPIKQYQAKYEPPAPDAFASSQPTQYAQPARTTQQTPPPPQTQPGASWGQPGAQAPPSSQPGGWPAGQPARQGQLPGSAPKGVGGPMF